MSHYILLDAMSIQRYIFDTNKLRIIIGASQRLAAWQHACKQKWPNHVLVSAGGNVLARFESEQAALAFKDQAKNMAPPGMDIAWAMAQEAGADIAVWDALQVELTRYKCGDRPPQDYDQSLYQPFIPGCRYCGVRPEDGKGLLDPHGNEKQPVCAVCRTRYGEGKKEPPQADTAIGKLWQYVKGKGVSTPFPAKLEDVVRKKEMPARAGESAYDLLAVVVVDLNDMGTRLHEVVKKNGFAALGEFSEKLQEDLNKVFRVVLNGVIPDQDWLGHGGGEQFLRFRPLLLGGDDIALAIPAPLWPAFVSRLLNELAPRGYPACAGVTVAKHTFPINRLVEMSEELVGSAKALVRYQNQQEQITDKKNDVTACCALDWHVHQQTAFDSPLAIRKKQYVFEGDRNLGFEREDKNSVPVIQVATAKPYMLADFQCLLTEGEKLKKSIPRGKLFALYSALRDGCQATRDCLVRMFLRNENQQLGKYKVLWDKLCKDQWPLWVDFQEGSRTKEQPCYTEMADILELLLLTDTQGEDA